LYKPDTSKLGAAVLVTIVTALSGCGSRGNGRVGSAGPRACVLVPPPGGHRPDASAEDQVY